MPGNFVNKHCFIVIITIAGLFFRLSNHIPRKVLAVLYHSLIHSKISYCIDSWGNAPKTHISNLTKFQKKIIRIVFKKPIDYPSSEVFKCSKLLSIEQMCQLKILMSAHSLFYSSSTHSSHNYSTRSSLFNLPTPFLLPLLGKDGLRNYHFYGTIYLQY